MRLKQKQEISVRKSLEFYREMSKRAFVRERSHTLRTRGGRIRDSASASFSQAEGKVCSESPLFSQWQLLYRLSSVPSSFSYVKKPCSNSRQLIYFALLLYAHYFSAAARRIYSIPDCKVNIIIIESSILNDNKKKNSIIIRQIQLCTQSKKKIIYLFEFFITKK